MINQCPGCGRIYPEYSRQCKCGHKFSPNTEIRFKTARQISINGKALKCSHCNGQLFTNRKAQLNTAGMAFFDLDWLNKSAEVFVCEECGKLEWFLDPSISIQNDESE